MPRLTESLAEDVMNMSKDSKFVRLLEHFKAIEAEMQVQINSTLTPKDERELLVHVKDKLRREVIDVVKLSEDVLRKKDQLVGKA